MFILVPRRFVGSVYVSNTARNKSASTPDPVLHGVSQGLSRNPALTCAMYIHQHHLLLVDQGTDANAVIDWLCYSYTINHSGDIKLII